MKKIKSICVFCGSSSGTGGKYMRIAQAAGAMLARDGFEVVYGGARIGLMGALADAALAEGGKVTGVLPGFLKDKELAHEGLSELHLTETMHERQVGMAERADAFLILPGGLGTLAEFFEVLTWKQLGLHDKPVMLVNGYGYWDSLLAFSDHAQTEQFMRAGDRALFTTFDDIEALESYLKRL